ncbi:MAG: DUF1573 domain-containing protein [Bacteroidetes bacterium]|nr:DUF1573 domain-containing protein [Bacteroidota bacterium]
MKKILLLIAVASASLAAFAQDGPAIKFEELHFDMGKIKETGGHSVHTFKFKNIGNQPLKVDRVQPSCGCTTPEWTKEEIKPGQEGFVKISFDPLGRPGSFTKSVQVYSNTNPNLTLVTFGGEVIPKQKTYEDSFPNVTGNLRYEQNIVNFGQLKNNVRDTTATLTLMNMSGKNMMIKDVKGSPYISIRTPFLIQPRVVTKLIVHYNATGPKDFGLMYEQVRLPPMTEKEKAKAPKIEFTEKVHDFGDVKEGETVHTAFKFTNKGKNELEVYKVKTTCGCTVAELIKRKFKHGESDEIKIDFNSSGKHGHDSKSITIYTNDPDNSELELKIMSNVVPATPVKQPDGKKVGN